MIDNMSIVCIIKMFSFSKLFVYLEDKMKIGKKIKDLRRQYGLTQEELAARTELSKGFISQIEHDTTSPSIATLVDILQCLGTNLEEFFAGTTQEQVVFREEEYFEKIDEERKNKIEWMIPNAQRNAMEPIRLTLEPGGSTCPDTPHEGEEFGYVLSGRIRIWIGKNSFLACKGESFYFKPHKKHYIEAVGKGCAKIIWISTPPSF